MNKVAALMDGAPKIEYLRSITILGGMQGTAAKTLAAFKKSRAMGASDGMDRRELFAAAEKE